MTAELEQNIGQHKFRPGESTGKPWGGNVADEPFAKALHEAALFCGLETQTALAVALGKGKTGQVRIGSWYRAETVPSPREFGNILATLKPEREIFERLVNSYGQLLRERRLRMSLVRMGASDDPLENQVKKLIQHKELTLKDFSRKLGFSVTFLKNGKMGLVAISEILVRAPEILGLSTVETTELAEAAASSVQKRILAGHKFSGIAPMHEKTIQKSLACKTYTGGQAARELGISRERVRVLRKEYRLGLLLTDDDIELLKARNKKRGWPRKILGRI